MAPFPTHGPCVLSFSLVFFQSASATEYHSSDFGWAANQNVTIQLSNLLRRKLRPGDTLILDEMYDINGGAELQLPDNFTLSAEFGGGFDIQNTENTDKPILYMGAGSVLDNVTITASGAPDTGYEGLSPTRGVDFHSARAIGINQDNVTISHGSFSGNIGQFLDVNSSDNLLVENTHFLGGHYQVGLGGGSDDATFIGTHFEDALGDGIKTIRSGGDGVERLSVINCLFEGNNRDGIDTTGGFKNGLVQDTIFYANGMSGMDLKKGVDTIADISDKISISGIVIDGSMFVKSNNGIVTSMVDRLGIAAKDMDLVAPHDITITDSTYIDVNRAVFVKDGYDITWSGLRFHNVNREVEIRNINAPEDWHRLSDGAQNIWGEYEGWETGDHSAGAKLRKQNDR